MEHHNRGYDIESLDSDGQIARYIEVKSLAGEWGPDGMPELSPAQYDFARSNGQQVWLYVVEFAETAPRITRINDPFEQATKYVFDPGWRALGEATPVDFDELAQAVREAGLPAPELRYVAER